jgi:energy-coupling factor transport system permease protein
MSVFDGLRFRRVTSPVHRLDPRVKFFFVCSVFVGAIIFSEALPLAIMFLFQIPLVFLAGVKKEWLRSLRGAAFLAAVIFGTNILFRFMSSGLTLSLQDVEFSSSMTLRFIVLVESFSLFFLTTSPDHLGLALEKSRIPYEFCFAFTTAVRFVPVLAEEAQTIMDAQKARGLELEKGNFLKRIRNYVPILIPLIIGAIRRSLELAEAMESRAWGAIKKRTNLYTLKVEKADLLLIGISILLLAVSVYARLFLSIPTFSALLGP